MESNSTTGKCWPPASFSLTLTRLPDQSNEPNPDFDQFGDGFNWDEEFGGDFDEEFEEFEDQINVGPKPANPQEPASGNSTKRGFDEVDSDTADEEETQGDVSPSKSLCTPLRVCPELTWIPSRFKTEEGAVAGTYAERVPFGHICGPCTILFSPTSHFNNRLQVKYLSMLVS